MQIIGRKEELAELADLLESKKPEFVAVYGRRRVGKTYLVREFFKDDFSFSVTARANVTLHEQLANFNEALQKYGDAITEPPADWFAAFRRLEKILPSPKRKRKTVIFIDEIAWMDTQKSRFLSALEYFWNSFASAREEIILIVCGSATSWIVKNIMRNRGGLHNRLTGRILLEPFSLAECEAYLAESGIRFNRHQILECYMILGGIPYYLSLLKKGLSLPQNIDRLCFSERGSLRDEFQQLYASLFRHAEKHISIVEALSKKNIGFTRNEISKMTNISPGGGLTNILEELEQCGFIRGYRNFSGRKYGKLFQLVDFYTHFYFNFIRKTNDEHFWSNNIDSGKHRAWSGYAFEQICLAHTREIKNSLGISGISTSVSSWRGRESDPGAQIDLVIDRNDSIVNLCEMKYTQDTYSIDKKYSVVLRNKRESFRMETGTKKALHLTIVTTYGLRRNEYFGEIQSEITMDDLFRPIIFR